MNHNISIIGPASEEIARILEIEPTDLESADIALFIVSAVSGFSDEVTKGWEFAREHYIPSLIAIVDLDKSEIDFDDMAAIVGKTLDPVVTPYLVLHSDEGFPTALINLATLGITDYSLGLRKSLESEPEHRELVEPFREEFLEAMEVGGEAAFEAGVLFPAIPLATHIKLGVSEIREYLDRNPSLG